MNIKILRKQKGLTQKHLATIFGISRDKIFRYENGKGSVPSNILIEMAKFFEVSLDYLCGVPFDNKVGYIPDEKRDAVINLVNLSDKQFLQAESYIKALADQNKINL